MVNLLKFTGPQVTQEVKEEFQKTLGELDEGFDILAKRSTTIGVFETYINWLFDKGNGYYETKTKVQSALDNVIERENMGNQELIKNVFKVMDSVFESRKVTQKLINNVGKHLNDINIRYTTPKTRSAIESYKPVAVEKDETTKNMGKAFINHYIESFAVKLIENCFDSDFRKHFE